MHSSKTCLMMRQATETHTRTHTVEMKVRKRESVKVQAMLRVAKKQSHDFSSSSKWEPEVTIVTRIPFYLSARKERGEELVRFELFVSLVSTLLSLSLSLFTLHLSYELLQSTPAFLCNLKSLAHPFIRVRFCLPLSLSLSLSFSCNPVSLYTKRT